MIKFFRRREDFIERKGARPLSVAKARVFGVDGFNEQNKKKEIETMQKWLNEVEQLICNQQVVGSTPTFCSKTDVFPVYSLSWWKNYSASE